MQQAKFRRRYSEPISPVRVKSLPLERITPASLNNLAGFWIRQSGLADGLVRSIRQHAGKPARFMEFCGGHTMSIMKFGPDGIEVGD